MAKVLLHTLVFAPDGVSTAHLMTDLARELGQLGHSVEVLTTTPHYNPDLIMSRQQPLRKRWFGLLYTSLYNNMPVWHVRIPMKGKRIISRIFDYAWFHLMSLFVGISGFKSYDIVIAPSPPLSIGVIGWLLGVYRRVPFVYNIQEMYPDFAINQRIVKNRLIIKLLRILERFVYTQSKVLVPISERFSNTLKERGVPKEKIRVIPNFVDTELYKPLPRKNPFSDKYDFMKNFVVLYGGNLGLSQDWESLLLASKAVMSLPITFLIVGDGVLRHWLEQEANKRGLHNIKLLDYQPRETMPYVYASCDICTIPMKKNTTSDTFPSKIYTIMACAKPVIASADGDSELRWLIKQAQCGRLIQPENPERYTEGIVQAFEDRSHLPTEGERGRLYILSRYSKEFVAHRYKELIDELTIKRN